MKLFHIIKINILILFILFSKVYTFSGDLTGDGKEKTLKELESEYEIEFIKKNDAGISESDYIKILESNKKYIQISAFHNKEKAESFFLSINGREFIKKIFFDADGLFKILIIAEPDDNEIVNSIIKNIAPDAFIKKK
jgi:hypothetical protein